MIAKSDTANTQNSAAISGCERRFVRRFAGRHWDLVSREEILRAVGESPVCYDDACDPGWRNRKDSILRKLKKAELIRHSRKRNGFYRIIAAECLPNVRCGGTAAQEPENQEEADRRLPRTPCSFSSFSSVGEVFEDGLTETRSEENHECLRESGLPPKTPEGKTDEHETRDGEKTDDNLTGSRAEKHTAIEGQEPGDNRNASCRDEIEQGRHLNPKN
jgi:hypothetical protein